MKRIHIHILLLFTEIFSCAFQTSGDREYRVKAAFLFNFTQFVEWPAGALDGTGTPFVIGILGENPFGNYLREIVAGESVNGHPLTIHQYKNVDEIKLCHILFINPVETSQIREVTTALQGRNILTVSDAASFIQSGGMIRLIKIDNKIRIQVNPVKAKEADLIISSKLLGIADIVSPNNN
jgi:hypothetical protein